MHSIITHPGPAHPDDFLSTCISLGWFPSITNVFRREPLAEELNNPNVIVLDIGGKHESHLNNYDHHQYLGGDATLTLVFKSLGFYSQMSPIYPWIDTYNTLDVAGPNKAGQPYGLTANQYLELRSPVEDTLLALFSQMAEVEPWLLYTMRKIGAKMLADFKEIAQRMEVLDQKTDILTVNGQKVLVSFIREQPSFGLFEFIHAKHPETAVVVFPDDRGPGWSLMRYNDHSLVDFTKIKDHKQVVFVHASGFVAKTIAGLEMFDLRNLLNLSIVEQPV